jgi:hypothetical protein
LNITLAGVQVAPASVEWLYSTRPPGESSSNGQLCQATTNALLPPPPPPPLLLLLLLPSEGVAIAVTSGAWLYVPIHFG